MRDLHHGLDAAEPQLGLEQVLLVPVPPHLSELLLRSEGKRRELSSSAISFESSCAPALQFQTMRELQMYVGFVRSVGQSGSVG